MENTELEESSMNGVSNRKKSFLDELIRNYANFIMVLADILYFTIAGISKVYMDFGHSIETGMKDDTEK